MKERVSGVKMHAAGWEAGGQELYSNFSWNASNTMNRAELGETETKSQ